MQAREFIPSSKDAHHDDDGDGGKDGLKVNHGGHSKIWRNVGYMMLPGDLLPLPQYSKTAGGGGGVGRGGVVGARGAD